MSWLALDASGSRAGLAVLDDGGAILREAFAPLKPGLIETLPVLLAEALEGQTITNVAVGIGPGSFTGLRTVIALAQGYAAAAALPLWGVPVVAAFQQALPGLHHPLWGVVRARKGRVFLLQGETAEAFVDEDVPSPGSLTALAGEAAAEIAARLAARGADIMLTNVKTVHPAWVGRAAQAWSAAGLPPHPALPLYVDPPEAKLPSAGLRPAPV
ncbi:tRNA (adenosine(37)-N6)-threonylcarbamoyltransferase complex dimerization subunit type 1 TsaB [Acidocella sp.]|uniref:tRNA (adenosine(37)-N6)-threonylcarbamoyltransferase complex dimerization subunit type 1 TsaB n=1 Tax=Acidocella sp. TaxID=50710 RepID=UPI002624DA3D|nr:tRNA (adenosine(37)-N6)-threonylcarbamoyltransferase complex dimerization subunit type 1 TsaB [Acidocella sp.]